MLLAAFGGLACVSPRTDVRRADLLVACDFDHAPFASLDTEGLPVGRDVDMMRELARRLDRVLVWRRVPFEGLIEGIELGEFDVACATLGITEERAARVDFTRPYYQTVLSVVVLGAPDAPDTLAELAGARVGCGAGTSAEEAVGRCLPAAQLVLTGEEAPAMLRAGGLDAIVVDAPDAERMVLGGGGKLRILGESLAPEHYALAVVPGLAGGALLRALDAELDRMDASGRLAQLDERFGL